MNIGTSRKRTKKLQEPSQDKIDPEFFRVKFKINGKTFEKVVDDLVSFNKENLDELSDSELDKALDKVSYWRFTFLAAAAELEQKANELEVEFNSWYAKASEQAKKDIINNRIKVKQEQKVPNNWFGSITKQEIEGYILTDPEGSQVYHDYQNKISELRRYMKILFGLRDILQDRGGYLQSIGRRRLENAKMNFRTRDDL